MLVSNDDGIAAPGIKALTSAIIKAAFCDVYVCAPTGERSAQSHAITLGRYLQCTKADDMHPGALQVQRHMDGRAGFPRSFSSKCMKRGRICLLAMFLAKCSFSRTRPGLQVFAVDGTPADAVMLALCSPVFQVGGRAGGWG